MPCHSCLPKSLDSFSDVIGWTRPAFSASSISNHSWCDQPFSHRQIKYHVIRIIYTFRRPLGLEHAFRHPKVRPHPRPPDRPPTYSSTQPCIHLPIHIPSVLLPNLPSCLLFLHVRLSHYTVIPFSTVLSVCHPVVPPQVFPSCYLYTSVRSVRKGSTERRRL